jgi:hypothetical protein
MNPLFYHLFIYIYTYIQSVRRLYICFHYFFNYIYIKKFNLKKKLIAFYKYSTVTLYYATRTAKVYGNILTLFLVVPISFISFHFHSIQFNSIQFNSIQFNSIQFNSIRFDYTHNNNSIC